MIARLSLILLAILLAGCSAGPAPKSLAGVWSSTTNEGKTVLVLSEDGTAQMASANEFAGAALKGTYEQSPGRLTIRLNQNDLQPTVAEYACRWIGPKQIGLRADQSKVETVFDLVGPAPSTASSSVKPPNPASGAYEAQMEDSTCLSNMKQLGIAAMLYAADSDDTLPPATAWAPSIDPYVKNPTLFTCPTLAKASNIGGYAMDSRLSATRISSIKNPKETILFFESTEERIGAADPQTSILTNPRHRDGISLAYTDGHAQQKKP